LGDNMRELRIALQSAHIVDDMRAGLQRRDGNFGLHGIHGEHGGGFREPGNNWAHPVDLVLRGNRGRLRAGRFTPYVEDRGTCFRQFAAVLNRGLSMEEPPAVGKGIGRDVEDPHDDRGAGTAALAPPPQQFGKSDPPIVTTRCAAALGTLRRHCGLLSQRLNQHNATAWV
jgi:hypothetical protein